MSVFIVLSGLVKMSAKDAVIRLTANPNPQETKAFLQSLASANDSTAKAVITQIKKMLKDRTILPTVKLAALQLFHQCMGVNNLHFLLFAQKKILRRFGEFARHRKPSADPGRGADLFGTFQGDQRAASIEFHQLLLQYIKIWASRYGIAPAGGDSDYLRLYRTLETERVVFPADNRAPAQPSSPRAPQSNTARFQAELSKCRQTADVLRQMLAANPNQSEIAPTASQVSAYKAQLEVEIQTRSGQGSSEAELNLLLDAHDHLSTALEAYEVYKKGRKQDPKAAALNVTLKQTQDSIDQAEKELSEIRNRIYFMRTTEDQSNPEQVKKEIEARLREREMAHRAQLAQLDQNLNKDGPDLEQQLAETMRLAEQLQTALRQKTAEVDRDKKLYAQVTAENRELAARLEEASKKAYIKTVDSPPHSPEPQEPGFFASARPSMEVAASPVQDYLDPSVFQTLQSPAAATSPAPVVDASGLPIANEKEYRLLCQQEKGLLFEDSVVKMGIQMQLTGLTGKCIVFLGNGSQEVLEGVAIQVIPVPGLDLQQEAKEPMPVQPGQKAVFQLQVNVQQPFLGCPRLLAMYLHHRTPIYVHLKLPIVLARALQPVHFEAPEAYRNWQSLSDTEDLVRFSGLQAGINSMNSLATVLRFRSNLLLYGTKDLQELEKGAVLGLGCFGDQLVATMVTIERNAKSGRIAVRSRVPRLRDALLALLKDFIVG